MAIIDWKAASVPCRRETLAGPVALAPLNMPAAFCCSTAFTSAVDRRRRSLPRYGGLTMELFVANLLKSASLLSFDLLVRSSATFPGPERVPKGQLRLVRDGDVEKWACLTCPGGCGRTINLSLNPKRRPRWSVVGEFWRRPTVQP